jgi:hypothetical protein
MTDSNSEIRQAIAEYDRAALKDYVFKGGTASQRDRQPFSPGKLVGFAVRTVCACTADSEDSFCSWLERKSQELGSIRGGTARKLFALKDEPGWRFNTELSQASEEAERTPLGLCTR